jgi:acetyl esterase
MLDPDIAALMGNPEPMAEFSAALMPGLRANMAMIGKVLPGADLSDVRDYDADGVPVRLYRPSDNSDLPLLVFLHGGGWMLGDLDTHDAMHRHLARRAGCAVLAVGYRLAPENPFPAGLDDATAALEWARREARDLGCDPVRIALGGESAGANLAAALTLRLRDTQRSQPSFQLLVHPATDLTLSYPSIDEVAMPGLTRAYFEACVSMYAGDAGMSHPLVSPMFADRLDNLAPAIVITVSEDPLRDDGERYASRLVAHGVETLACRLPGLPHGFMFLPATVPAINRAFDLMARLVRRYVDADVGLRVNSKQ